MALEELPPNFDDAYLKEVREQKDLLAQGLLNGNARTFDDYKYMVGQYRGLVVAENHFNDLVAKWNNR